MTAPNVIAAASTSEVVDGPLPLSDLDDFVVAAIAACGDDTRCLEIKEEAVLTLVLSLFEVIMTGREATRKIPPEVRAGATISEADTADTRIKRQIPFQIPVFSRLDNEAEDVEGTLDAEFRICTKLKGRREDTCTVNVPWCGRASGASGVVKAVIGTFISVSELGFRERRNAGLVMQMKRTRRSVWRVRVESLPCKQEQTPGENKSTRRDGNLIINLREQNF